jgi:hypothetical protein
MTLIKDCCDEELTSMEVLVLLPQRFGVDGSCPNIVAQRISLQLPDRHSA